ncbi:hypothetical protein FQA39_LY13084 [Lamprigera yunnana]|nr:hypothetical protein FQA39_LY13084 [Lamprigera yunnana]
MERWKGKVAIVTGANSGIGAEVTERLVQEGMTVVGIDIGTDYLQLLCEKLNKENKVFYCKEIDIRNEEEVIKAFRWISENVGAIYVLVNSAGVCRNTSLMNGQTKFWNDVIDINVFGLCVATREAVKNMKANNVAGHIIHMNSIAGHIVPCSVLLNVYPASKHAVTALTETLRLELMRMGPKIKVTSISPGMVKTGLLKATAVAGGFVPTDEQIDKFLHGVPILQVSDVADGILFALATPPHVQVHELSLGALGEQDLE